MDMPKLAEIQKIAEAKDYLIDLVYNDPEINMSTRSDATKYVDGNFTDNDFRDVVNQYRSSDENQYRMKMKTATESLLKKKKRIIQG